METTVKLRFLRCAIKFAAALTFAGATLVACGSDDGGAAPSVTPAAFKLNISKTEDVAGSFGNVGVYERITGTFIGEVDPKDSKNAIVQDLSLARSNTAPTL